MTLFSTITELLFWTFALGATVSGFMVISSTNPVHSIFSLILVFANSSALLLLIQGPGLTATQGQGAVAEYLAFLFIIVYVGAIAILFLFVVMMLNIKLVEMIDPAASRYIPIGGIIGAVFLAETYGRLTPQIGAPTALYSSVNDVLNGNLLFNLGEKGVHLIASQGGTGALPLAGESSSNLSAMGLALFSNSTMGYVIIASFVLFVAMIGAIVLTLSHEKGIKRQDIFSQTQASLA